MSELPPGWDLATGNDLFASVRGVTYSKSDARSVPASGLVPVLRANNISGGEIVADDLVFVPLSCVSPEQYLRPGDLLIATSSGSRTVVGKAAPANESHTGFAFGAFCTVARPRQETFGGWLSWFARTRAYRNYVEQVALGISINNLRGSDLQSISVPTAPLPEQRRIVAKIDSLTGKSKRAREHLDHIPRLVEKYKQAVLAAAFRGDLNSDDVDLRRGWTAATLADVGIPGRAITYGVIKLGAEVKDGVPCLRTSNVRWLRIDIEGVKRIAPILSREYHRTILSGGEVLVNVRGTLGGVAVAPPNMSGWNVSREVAVVPVDRNQLIPAYAAYWMAAASSQQWLTGVEKGVAYTGINIEDLRKLPIEYPRLDLQLKIVRRIENAFTWIDRLAAEATSARKLIDHLNQAVLAEAFSGELVPQDPNDEPASVLLDRMRAQPARTASRRRDAAK